MLPSKITGCKDVIPANAGIHISNHHFGKVWIPAFAGMTYSLFEEERFKDFILFPKP